MHRSSIVYLYSFPTVHHGHNYWSNYTNLDPTHHLCTSNTNIRQNKTGKHNNLHYLSPQCYKLKKAEKLVSKK